MKRGKSHLEERALKVIQIAGYSDPEQEFHFHPVRKWRFDFAYPAQKIAIEIEGAVWSGGRHTRGSGFTQDMEKYNTATLMGWKVLRYSGKTLGNIVRDLGQILDAMTGARE